MRDSEKRLQTSNKPPAVLKNDETAQAPGNAGFRGLFSWRFTCRNGSNYPKKAEAVSGCRQTVPNHVNHGHRCKPLDIILEETDASAGSLCDHFVITSPVSSRSKTHNPGQKWGVKNGSESSESASQRGDHGLLRSEMGSEIILKGTSCLSEIYEFEHALVLTLTASCSFRTEPSGRRAVSWRAVLSHHRAYRPVHGGFITYAYPFVVAREEKAASTP